MKGLSSFIQYGDTKIYHKYIMTRKSKSYPTVSKRQWEQNEDYFDHQNIISVNLFKYVEILFEKGFNLLIQIERARNKLREYFFINTVT